MKKHDKATNTWKPVGCSSCTKGWVRFHRIEPVSGRMYDGANPCAYCHDEHSSPMLVLKDGKLYWASRKVDRKEIRDLNNLQEATGLLPGWKNDARILKGVTP